MGCIFLFRFFEGNFWGFMEECLWNLLGKYLWYCIVYNLSYVSFYWVCLILWKIEVICDMMYVVFVRILWVWMLVFRNCFGGNRVGKFFFEFVFVKFLVEMRYVLLIVLLEMIWKCDVVECDCLIKMKYYYMK